MNKEYNNIWSDEKIIKLAEVYYHEFETEKNKLPYWMDLIDVVGANENAHTRILQILLSYKSENNYLFFDSFIRRFAPDRKEFNSIGRYLFRLNHHFKIHNGENERKRYTDIYTHPSDYKSGVSIIIENKINYAKDRIGQVEDYIKGMYDDRKDNHPDNIPNNNCYAFYLISEMSSFKRKDGQHDEKGRQCVKNDILGQYIADNHYVLLTYKEDILPWLKEELLPNVRYNEKHLIQNIELYVSHLENRFNMREDINKIQLNILHNMEDVKSLKLQEMIELRKAIETSCKKQKTELLDLFEHTIRNKLKNYTIYGNKGNNEYYKGFYVNIKGNTPLSFYCELNASEDGPHLSFGIAEDYRTEEETEKYTLTKESIKDIQQRSEELISNFNEIENKGIENKYYPKFSFYNLTYKNIEEILKEKFPDIIDKFKEKFL